MQANNYKKMTNRKPVFAIIVCAMLAMLMLGCQRRGTDGTSLDKDEEHDLVVANELSNSRVQCIAEDADGYLWIGTFRGLNRYDGHEYHQYFCTFDSLGLPDNQIQSLLCDQQGRLWVATVNGVCRYTRQDNFESIPMQTSNRNARKLLMDSKGRIFAYNGMELLMYDEQQHIFLSKFNRTITNQSWGDCFIDGADNILMVGSDNLLVINGETFKQKAEVKAGQQLGFYFFELLPNGLLLCSGKYMDGHATQVGGVVVDSGNFDWDKYAEKFPCLCTPDESYHGLTYTKAFGKMAYTTKLVAQLMRDLGSIPSPQNAFLLNLGLETLHLRMPRHCENAQKVAEWLEKNPKVGWINYAGLPSNKYYPLAQKYLPNGSCGVMAFGLKGTKEEAIRFMDNLEFISIVTHVADARTCVLHPASHTHRQLSDEQLREAGIAPDLVRLSVGLENIDDIIADLEQAMAKM